MLRLPDQVSEAQVGPEQTGWSPAPTGSLSIHHLHLWRATRMPSVHSDTGCLWSGQVGWALRWVSMLRFPTVWLRQVAFL